MSKQTLEQWYAAGDRFDRYTRKAGECVEWTAGLTSRGYGKFYAFGKTWIASRFSYARHIRRLLLPDECVLHTCDNRRCVRIEHLFIGTKAQNNADRKAKGRNAYQRGEHSPRAVLTPSEVQQIRSSSGLLRECAALFGVSEATVSRIRRGITW